MLSQKTARVSSSINAAMLSGRSLAAKRTVTPWRRRWCANSVCVVP